ncbi:MBL fold metallo-hydrolase [Leptospira meyeri]|uniref:L-ascorbate metabolism protein UlaG (Beta-lactamase superfamily) n=1 Tax=Leptospira meyeri TaxID=29508 RepID=A0A4R8MS21_LEPME|nr:MBL fold metallo-hydrolase [Leptospira meyeri]PKA25320.1 MBL fold metallo-hydrolase [Leptospira sp. mixed culture ATI2-C-A1]EKJ87703.1 beta-lactamase family protein [Leptospira meyeri serovar Hardjo str. Went 5]MCW7489450.1 MBL fold metallo-hydrolase [Leptospira meyeri]PJZ82205.1 MBL fold metallo-hydrolase [Leptospira meyeri]PJZ97708.1 MBL fold metallo-hydrolase [Leptospira meyeri]
MATTLGKLPHGDILKRISQSEHFQSGSFQNIEHTEMLAPNSSYWKMAIKYWQKPNSIRPSSPIPSTKINLKELDANKAQYIWFGHSSYLLLAEGKKILVDPVFSGYASPVPFAVQSFEGTDIYLPEDMPDLDILIITHDHYDHLDYETMLKIHPRTKKIIVPLGVSAHLLSWGVPLTKIIELDWFETKEIDSTITVTATPTRHFSGRSVLRNKSLWCSYVLKLGEYKVFIGGDSGYGSVFESIGKKYGPFDLAFLECGQYGDDWPSIHMRPEETALAAANIGAKSFVPVHWGKFILSLHPWNDPIKRVLAASQNIKLNLQVPKIGESFEFTGSGSVDGWWNFQ